MCSFAVVSVDGCLQLAYKFTPFLVVTDHTLLQHSPSGRAILVCDTNHLMKHLVNLFLVACSNCNVGFIQNVSHMTKIAGHET